METSEVTEGGGNCENGEDPFVPTTRNLRCRLTHKFDNRDRDKGEEWKKVPAATRMWHTLGGLTAILAYKEIPQLLLCRLGSFQEDISFCAFPLMLPGNSHSPNSDVSFRK